MSLAARNIRQRRGQAMTEYIVVAAVLIALVWMGLMGFTLPGGARVPGFLESVGAYYQNIVKVVSLPFP
jgi:hypothetical protein